MTDNPDTTTPLEPVAAGDDYLTTTYDPSQTPEAAPEAAVADQTDDTSRVSQNAETIQEDDPDADARIKRAWVEARQAKRESERLRREVERLRGERVENTDEQVDRLANERAAGLAAQVEFNKECNRIFDEGNKEFGDFQKSIDSFAEIGGLTAPLVQACIESGDAHKVLHWLGDNLDEAERITKLDPVRMGAAIAKVGAKLTAPKAVSKAPRPITPVNGVGKTTDKSPDEMDVDEWMRFEDSRMAKKRAERLN